MTMKKYLIYLFMLMAVTTTTLLMQRVRLRVAYHSVQQRMEEIVFYHNYRVEVALSPGGVSAQGYNDLILRGFQPNHTKRHSRCLGWRFCYICPGFVRQRLQFGLKGKTLCLRAQVQKYVFKQQSSARTAFWPSRPERLICSRRRSYIPATVHFMKYPFRHKLMVS